MYVFLLKTEISKFLTLLTKISRKSNLFSICFSYVNLIIVTYVLTLMSSADCLNASSRDCFSILGIARTKHQLRIKESLYVSWLKLTLNKKVASEHHFFVHLTSPLFFFPLLHFGFLSYSISDVLRQVDFLNINSIFNS